MPLIIPKDLPAYEELQQENVFVMHQERAMSQHIRPLRILILNLMPTKIVTETQLARLLANSPLQVQLTLLQTATHAASHVSAAHLEAFYKTFDQIEDERFDGMIITGAPVENMAFEEVAYWDEIAEIMEWSKSHVYSTFHICWGAQAGLYYHYGIPKYEVPEKIFGVFKHHLCVEHEKLLRGFDDEFYVPHSRHTEEHKEDILKVPELTILAEAEGDAGVYAIANLKKRQFFITGHAEYDPLTLKQEYDRDEKAGMNPKIPQNYYPDDDPTKKPVVRWRSVAHLLFANWLNYYVYQETPYVLDELYKEEDD